MADAANSDQVAYWNGEVGEVWAEMQARMDVQLEPLGAAALEALAPRPGEHVLDVGCGCGATTLALAQALGPSGRVLGVDVSKPMLAIARRRPHPASAAPFAFEAADAQTHGFAAAFDAIYSRFGVMFFADPAAAFANLHRALRPGGRLAWVVWRPAAENPMFTAPMAAAARHLPAPAPPADPYAPSPFALADAARTRALLQAAGFHDVDIAPLDLEISPGGLEAAMAVALGIGPLAALLQAHPHAREAATVDLRAALEKRLQGGRVTYPAAVWIVVAQA